jgi:hypothetical protein
MSSRRAAAVCESGNRQAHSCLHLADIVPTKIREHVA